MSIWIHKQLKNTLSDIQNQLTLDEGNTPLESYQVEGINLKIKREDKNPTGSWKDRGTAFKISNLKEKGVKEGVLFSSGNAVISFLNYLKLYPEFKLNIVVSEKIVEEKLLKIYRLIENTHHELFISESPKSKAIEIAGSKNIPNLRVSLDNDIVKGYWSLGFELANEIKRTKGFKEGKNDSAIFVQASSGTTLVGLCEGLLLELGNEFSMPQIYVCQTESTHPFVLNAAESTSESLADAIVDKVGLRKPQVEKIIRETRGNSFAITNAELIEAEEFYSKLNPDQKISYTSLLSLAGFIKAKKDFSNAFCIFSGL